MTEFSAGGNAYDDCGEGDDAILFLPGWCGPRTIFQPIADRLSADHRTLALDWRGQGFSTRALGKSRKGYVRSFAEYGFDLEGFVNEALLPDCAPPYFALNETAVGEYRTFAKLSPPLRGEWDRRAVIEGLRDGTIDAIASDHAPHDQDSKRLPFASAESGIIGLETLLPLSLELYHNGHLPLIDLLRALTCAPADILRLPAGRLVVGAAADLVAFDLERPWQIAESAFRSKSKNSPFDGRPVQGAALSTVVGGRIVYQPRD